MERKVHWSGIEYSYRNPSEQGDLKGGFVYVFVQAFDVRDALDHILKSFEEKGLEPIEIEYISKYDKDMEWKSKKQTEHYANLCSLAMDTTEVIFDDFYAYENE